MPDVLTLAAQYRAALLKQDAAVLARVVNAYTSLYGRLDDLVAALTLEIGDGLATAGEVARMARYRRLLAEIETEVGKFANFTETEMLTASRAAIDMASKHAAGLVDAVAPGVTAGFNRLPTGAIESLLGFLDRGGPLFERLQAMAGLQAESVGRKLLEGVGLGYNPKKLAGLIRDEMGGSLTDALRMTRTVQLYSYREATRANYAANPDVVEGWYWYAELDPDTCASCIAQHGSLHTIDEVLNDHHNGRCAMVPAVIGADNPIGSDGETWFNGLSEAEQRRVLGDGKYDAWKAGDVEFGAFSGTHDDPVYGPMRVEASLKELTG